MEAFIAKLRRDFPAFSFIEGEVAHWSPAGKEIYFRTDASQDSLWTVLHELGHAIEGHDAYRTDIDLLKKEVDAWTRARQIGSRYGVKINTEYIEECLDSYRDWVHKRSTCPHCHLQGVQQIEGTYACPNCSGIWRVGSDRFCRPYRLRKALRA
jgi:hypothetical protein